MKPFSFADKNLQHELETVAIRKSFASNEVLMNPGDVIQYVPIVEAPVKLTT